MALMNVIFASGIKNTLNIVQKQKCYYLFLSGYRTVHGYRNNHAEVNFEVTVRDHLCAFSLLHGHHGSYLRRSCKHKTWIVKAGELLSLLSGKVLTTY